jgi:magnesium-transporting ATPase (P-type)
VSSAFQIVSQALTNILFMAVGVNFAKGLEERARANSSNVEMMMLQRIPIISQNCGRLGLFANTVSRSMILQSTSHSNSNNDNDVAVQSQSTDIVAGGSILSSVLRRQPFQPNFETNVVFLLSILQSAIVSLFNHQGKPFQQSVFETRELCWNFGATILFYFVGVSGIIPSVTRQLDVKPFPTRQSKITMILIGFLNVLACFICRMIADVMYWRGVNKKAQTNLARTSSTRKSRDSQFSSTFYCAADQEEELLEEESHSNAAGLKGFAALMVVLLLDLVKSGRGT